jgi:hypothetical protein
MARSVLTPSFQHPIVSRVSFGVVITEPPNFQWTVDLKKAVRTAVIAALPPGTGVGEVDVTISQNCLSIREN